MQKLNVVVLAAGKGTRMYSDLPKVLHQIAGRTLLSHVLGIADELQAERTVVVLGHQADKVSESLVGSSVQTVLQEPQAGTAHAVQQALPHLDPEAMALILYADVPLIRAATLQTLLHSIDSGGMAVLTSKTDNPAGLGRIVRNSAGSVERIVEERDATPEEKQICEINTGIMAIAVKQLQAWLPRIGSQNAQGEYYLTDVVALANADGCPVHTATLADEKEAAGVNNRLQLAELERHFQAREAERLMLAGLTLRDPARFDIRGELLVGKDAEIDINVVIVGKVKLGDRVRIGPNCILRDCEIGDDCVIHANTIIGESVVGARCDVGPFARIRPGTLLEPNARIGNFVEVKKSRIGEHSKVNHLSYVGDSTLGSGVNIGAGTITCNYDGVNKSQTIIGNDVFIGSNTALVAPVRVADGATVGAGSVITHDVPQGQLALTRSPQKTHAGWQRPKKRSDN
ncbi:MAG TPA: bifunctional UDP-N-acetylglucosamine diphosphorylase/glucosamine-1-phosphate N-acetyltransferase GlmU [Pseudomonadaceae bacterium]|nr:bifunctional UDP-N-acetylglucosamine diphosphorylase/glucosamine-1-phosphate N-acetyltransferase GlmU [Pseudomonadaceae bacterium]